MYFNKISIKFPSRWLLLIPSHRLEKSYVVVFLIVVFVWSCKAAPTSNWLEMSGPEIPVPFTESSLWVFGHEGGAAAYYSSMNHNQYYSRVCDHQSILFQSVWSPENITPECLITRVYYSRVFDHQSILLQSVWSPEYIIPECLITRVYYSRVIDHQSILLQSVWSPENITP